MTLGFDLGIFPVQTGFFRFFRFFPGGGFGTFFPGGGFGTFCVDPPISYTTTDLDKTIIANDIGRYFVRKVENIRNEIDTTPISRSDRDLVPTEKPVVDCAPSEI